MVFASRASGRRSEGGQSERSRRHRRSRVFACVVACAVAWAAKGAAAAEADWSGIVQAGEGDRAVRSVAVGVARAFGPAERDGASPWSFYAEGIVGRWFIHDAEPGARVGFTQVTLAPVVRYRLDQIVPGTFFEVGIGLSLITPHFQDHARRFSTLFNFDDHASLGLRFGAQRENELSVRVEHFSNGGIRNPNPGQNFGQLRYARHF